MILQEHVQHSHSIITSSTSIRMLPHSLSNNMQRSSNSSTLSSSSHVLISTQQPTIRHQHHNDSIQLSRDTRDSKTHLIGRTDRPALIPIVTPRFPNLKISLKINQSFHHNGMSHFI